VHQDAPALIATHAALPTVHQDAPALIATHKGDASAHHAKYTDAEAVAALYAAKPCFSARVNTIQTDVTGDDTSYDITGAFWTEIKDQGANFANGIFTAPSTGVYLFTFTLALQGIAAAHADCGILLLTSNRNYRVYLGLIGILQVSSYVFLNFSIHADMDAADTAYINFSIGGGNKVVDIFTETVFSGSKII